MDRHKCKLCTRSFANGRALGGHMKAHLATLPLPKKTLQFVDTTTIESASSASLEGGEEEEKNTGGGEERGLIYGLRENTKKSFRVADPEFSFVAADAGSCVVVQDGEENETESRNPTIRIRSKRNRRFENQKLKLQTKKAKQSSWIINNNNKNNEYFSSPADPEPLSSFYDTSPEEDVAMCLMKLSSDCWMKARDHRSVEKSKETKLSKKKIRCEKCKKGFRSLQALGGHKRSHTFGSFSSTITATTTPTKRNEVSISIDLNLPAPVEEDEYSVVSDA